MTYEDFSRISAAYYASIFSTKFLYNLIFEVFSDFPKNIPQHVLEIMLEDIKKIEGTFHISHFKEEKIFFEFLKKETSKSISDFTKDYFIAATNFRLKSNIKPGFEFLTDIEHERLLNRQELIMIFTHLDAFLVDVLRLICQKQPNILKCNKKMTWREILDFDSIEMIKQNLTNEYTKEFNYLSLVGKINFLDEEFNLNLGISEIKLRTLNELENVRHILVHNAGRIDQQFIDRTQCLKLHQDDFYPLSRKLIQKTYKIIDSILMKLAREITNKFFKDSSM